MRFFFLLTLSETEVCPGPESKNISGAAGRTRTDTLLRATDLKSVVYAISPRRPIEFSCACLPAGRSAIRRLADRHPGNTGLDINILPDFMIIAIKFKIAKIFV